MENTVSLFPHRPTRIGFHYFQDDQHYREIDLETWIPELKALGASWIVLNAPIDRAIPEIFIQEMVQAEIEPILHFPVNYNSPPTVDDLDVLLQAYARWGVHGVIFGERPNARDSWAVNGWVQKDLVQRFMESFLPLATLSLEKGLTPIFPPLQPGGNFWDLAFLRTAIESLQSNQPGLLEHLVLSAYAWTNNLPLNWGAGGPERWPEAKPYYTPAGEENHCGFHIFDWYQAIVTSVRHQSIPMILLQTGLPGHPDRSTAPDDTCRMSQDAYAIARLMEKEAVFASEHPEAMLQGVPDSVLAANFWVLSDPPDGKYQAYAWYRNGAPSSITEVVKKWFSQPKQPQSLRHSQPKSPHSSHPIRHYLLLAQYEGGMADWQINMIRPLIQKYLPTIGFSLEEAALAAQVTVVGDEKTFPEDILDQLRFHGCLVERIRSTGINVAS